MTKTNMTNPEEIQFNESLITLLNGKQDAQQISKHDTGNDMQT